MTRLTLAWAAALAAPFAAQAQAPATVTTFTAGGIPVIYKPIAANDVVAVRLYLRGGSAVLSAANAGIERFIGQAATHGTAKFSKDQFSALATSTGTEVSYEVTYDFTVLTAQAVRQHWDEAWDLFTQAALQPTFPQDEAEQVRGQVLDELRQRHDVPDPHVTELADSMLYAGHAYALDPEGTPEAIAKLTRDELLQWHRRRFTKANLVLVVVGNVPPDDLARKVTAAFGALPATGGEPVSLAPLTVARPDLVVAKQALPTNYIMGLFSAPAPASPDYPAARVAIRVLSDRLFEEVRTKRNLSYAISAQLASRAANRGSIYVSAVEPDTTLKVMLAEVRRLQQEPVPVPRLGQSINTYLTAYLMSQQTNMGQASDLGLWELLGGGWERGRTFLDRLRAVTPEDVQRVARTYLKNFKFAVIGDPTKVDRGLFTSL